jgi:hypothetical protein
MDTSTTLGGYSCWTSCTPRWFRWFTAKEDVLLLGLGISDYWATLALRWVAETDITPALRVALESLAEAGPTQRVRHDAHHVLKGRQPKG